MKSIKSLLLKLYKKFIKISRKSFIILLIVSFLFSVTYTTFKMVKNSYSSNMTVTFNYESAKLGLNPDGSRFNIADIKSEEVLGRVIDILGDDTLSVRQLRDNIYIDSNMPLSAITQASTAISADSSYRYNPTEYVISYTQKNKIGKSNAKEFMEALSQAYSDFFAEKYADKNVILQFDGNNSFPQYDYKEIQEILHSKCTSMIRYIDSHNSENSAFRSKTTGYSFANISVMISNLRNKDLDKLDAYITQNSISKDTGKYIRKKQHLIEDRQTDYEKKHQASEIERSALDIYDPYVTGVAFIPSVDNQDEYYMSRTKTGIDNLVKQSYNDGVQATEILKKIDENQYLINKFSNIPIGLNPSDTTADANEADVDFTETVVLKDVTITDDKIETVNSMIVNICEYLEKISSIALLTDNDYIMDKTNNYVAYKFPNGNTAMPIISSIMGFAIFWFLGYVAIRLRKNIIEFFKAMTEKFIKDTNKNGEGI